MKKILSLLIAVAMLTTLFSSVAFSAGSVAGDAVFTGEAVVFEAEVLENGEPATDIRTGDTVTVNVVYKSGFNYFDSISLSLHYDDEIFAVGTTTLISMTTSRINADNAGEVLFVGVALSPISLSEGTVVASAEFEVIGEFDIDVDADIEVVFNDYAVTNDKGNGTFWEELGGEANPNVTVTLPVSFADADIVVKADVVRDTDSTLKALSYKANGKTTALELASGTTFNVTLPAGTTSVEVFAEKNSAKAETPVITNAVIENRAGVATVVVTAEDGSSTTYTINFAVEADNDSTLKSLSYKVGDAETVLDLASGTEFDVTLPVGTTAVEVFAEKSSDRAGEPVITNATIENRVGVATVVVTAEDGSSTTYTINFTVLADTDSTLKTLSYKVGEETTAIELTGETTYNVTLPVGTTAVEVFAEKSSDRAGEPVITNAVIENRAGVATVVVTAEDGTSTTYTINFTVLADSDSSLKSLLYSVTGGGTGYFDISGGKTEFEMEVPPGTTNVFVVPVANSSKARLTQSSSEADGKKIIKITATAEDGSSTVYTVTFIILKDTDSSLKSLSYKANGETTVLDLASGTTFNATLPYGTEVVEVFAEKNSERANEPVITNPVFENRAGVATVVVIAEDGSDTTYTINFMIEAPNTDSSLKTLAYRFGNEEQINITLEENKTDYEVTIPYGAVIPAVIAEADTTATAEVTVEENVATITVTAQDGSTTVYTITFIEEAKTYALTASARYGTILATYGDKAEENWYQTKTENYVTGTEFALKAVPESEDTEFLYWLDEGANRIVSYTEEYTFILGTKKDIVAVFVPKMLDDEAVYLVQFVDKNHKVYTSALSNTDINIPSDPYILGYTFEGWLLGGSLTEYQAGDVILAGTFTQATKLVAKQTIDETTYTVTVDGEVFGEYKYNDKVTVNSSSESFSYWMRDGQIVSYEKKYSFYMANYDTELVAVCVGEATKTPVITMAEPTIVAGNKISFIMERTLPEGFSVVEAGILLKEGNPEVIDLDNYTHIGTSTNKALTGSLALRKANVAEGEEWSAVGYLIYADKEGNINTIYSNKVTKSR